MMQIIRRIDNPLIIKAFGVVPEGGLGYFDPAIYIEETVEALPDGWLAEEIPPSKIELLKQYYSGLNLSNRLVLAPVIKLLIILTELNDTESLNSVVADPDLPEAIQNRLREILEL